jgi:hypothetical protein
MARLDSSLERGARCDVRDTLVGEDFVLRIWPPSGRVRPILLKNCSTLGQRGFAGGHKPSPRRVPFNSGHSMRSNFVAVPAPLRQTSFSTVSAKTSRSLAAEISAGNFSTRRRLSPRFALNLSRYHN